MRKIDGIYVLVFFLLQVVLFYFRLFCPFGNVENLYFSFFLKSSDYPENENIKNLLQEQLNSLSK